MSSRKQSLFDWVKENEKHLRETAKSSFLNCNKGVLRIKYESGFTYELREEDFPNRDLVPVFDNFSKKGKIVGYEQGIEEIKREGIKPSFKFESVVQEVEA